MRVFLWTLTLALAGAQAAPQTNQGVITGRVTRLGGSDPVAGVDVALITVLPTTNVEQQLTAIPDESAR